MARKRLLDGNFLVGQIEEITMMDFRKAPGDVIDEVVLGKTFIVTRQGKPMAVLQKLPGERLTINAKSDGTFSYKP